MQDRTALFLHLASLVVIGSCVASCTDAPSRGQRLWDTSTTLLTTVHVEGILSVGDGAIPLQQSHPCPDGGTIEMTVVVEGEPLLDNVTEMLHQFSDCSSDGLVMNGSMDYRNVLACADGTVSLSVLGNLVVSGDFEEQCAITGAETCGELAGNACGSSVK